MTASLIFAPMFNLGPTRESQICTSNQSESTSAYPTHGFSVPTSSNLGTLEVFPFFHSEVFPLLCLPLSVYQVMMADTLAVASSELPLLSSFGWSSFTSIVLRARGLRMDGSIQILLLPHPQGRTQWPPRLANGIRILSGLPSVFVCKWVNTETWMCAGNQSSYLSNEPERLGIEMAKTKQHSPSRTLRGLSWKVNSLQRTTKYKLSSTFKCSMYCCEISKHYWL